MTGALMDGQDGRDHPGIVLEFLDQYFRDQQAGEVKSLDHYRSSFRGYEQLVTEEYEKLQSGEATESTAHDGRQDQAAGDDESRSIGAFRTVRKLGEGGMGFVYLADQQKPVKRRVALKVIKPGMDSREVLARFRSEHQALALMQHRAIAQIYDAATTKNGRPFFVMEYVDGKPITEYCDEAGLSIRQRLELFCEVCEGVQHAHQKGIIHRDLKPSNILLSEDGAPKIIDFGIAKSLSGKLTDETLHTRLGQFIGTPSYMSPEQAGLNPLDVDTRTDIYALGVVLYELVAGVLPHDPEKLRRLPAHGIGEFLANEATPRPSIRFSGLPQETRTDIAERRETTEKQLVRDLRGDIDWIITRTLEKERSRRFGSAGELAEDIRLHLTHQPIRTRPPSFGYRFGKFCRRRRVPLAVAAAGIILAAAAWAGSARYGALERERAATVDYQRAQTNLDELSRLKEELKDLEEEYQTADAELDLWLPVWERAMVYRLQDRIQSTKDEIDRQTTEAEHFLQSARDQVPEDSEITHLATEELDDLRLARFELARSEQEVVLSKNYLRNELILDKENLSPKLTAALDERIRVRLRSDPPGAEVYCFRYERREERLLPLPFDPVSGSEDPAKGLCGNPGLVVEKLWRPPGGSPKAKVYPFEKGDQLLRVRDQDVKTRGELARTLVGVELDEEVSIEVRRQDERLTLPWIPFPAYKYVPRPAPDGRGLIAAWLPSPLAAGRLINSRDQFEVTFEGYPLEFRKRNRVETAGSGSCDLDLPPGSYLVVLRKPGFGDARFPLASPWRENDVTVRLVRELDVPPGFGYVPAGPFPCGGDPNVDQSLKGERVDIAGFFSKLHEVTVSEYVRFLNDRRVPAQGLMRPKAKPPEEWVPLISPGEILVVPTVQGQPWSPILYDNENARWQVSAPWHTDDPVLGVSALAALEYVQWLTETEGEGRWTFRLPSGREWEKAARGVDGRPYVWGDAPIWTFCWSSHGHYRGITAPSDVGSHPTDESVYGVRDLTGSLCEPTTDIVRTYVAYRGSSYFMGTEYFLRVTNRNGRDPNFAIRDGGIRVVCDLPE